MPSRTGAPVACRRTISRRYWSEGKVGRWHPRSTNSCRLTILLGLLALAASQRGTHGVEATPSLSATCGFSSARTAGWAPRPQKHVLHLGLSNSARGTRQPRVHLGQSDDVGSERQNQNGRVRGLHFPISRSCRGKFVGSWLRAALMAVLHVAPAASMLRLRSNAEDAGRGQLVVGGHL